MAKEFNIPGLKQAIEEVERLQQVSKNLAADLLNAAVSAEKALKPFINNSGLKNFVELTDKSAKSQKEVTAEANKLEQAQQRLAFAQSEVGKKIAAVNLETIKQNAENKKSAAQMNETRSALEKYNEKVLEATLKAKNLGAQMELLKMEGKETTPEYKKLEIQFEASAKTAKDLNDRYREISKSAGDNRALVGSYSEELKGHFEKLSSAFESLHKNIASGNFKGAINDVRTVVTGFGSEIKGINDTITSSIKGFFDYSSANKTVEVSTQAATVAVIEQTAVTEANIIVNTEATATQIGYTQAKEVGAVATEALAVTEGQAALSTEALAIAETEAAAAGRILASTNGSVATSTGAMTAGSVGAAAATEGLAASEAVATVATGALDVALAILLSPITVIVLALGLLYAIFGQFAPIVNPIKDAFSALGAVFASIKQDIFDFVTGARSLSEILDVFSTKTAEAAKEAYDLGQATRDLNKAMEIQEVTSARVSTTIQQLLLKGRDLSKSYDERNKYLIKAIELEREKSAQELKNNAEAIRIQAIRLFEGKELTEAVKKAIAEQDYAKIRSLKIKMNLDQEELDSYKKLLIEKESIEKAQISVEEKAQNRVNRNIQKKEAADEKAKQKAVKDQEDEVKRKEKAEKDKLDAEKKTADEAIKTMKFTLDNLISNYNQANKLDEENIAHVEAISAMKIQIANAEREKNLIGVKKGSIDEKSILNANAQEVIKITQERENALRQITIERQKFELELYDVNTQLILDQKTSLTDKIIEEQKNRIKQSLELHKQQMRDELGIDADTSDEKLLIYEETNAKLSKSETKYLAFIKTQTAKAAKDIETIEKNTLALKIKNIEEEEKLAQRKFRLLNKSSEENQAYEFQLMDKKLKKEKKIYEDDNKKQIKDSKEYKANVKEIEKIDLSLAENKVALDNYVTETKKKNGELALNLALNIFGQESEVGKAIAIAQIVITTIKDASKAFGIASVLAADPITAPFAANAYLQAGLITASGVAQAAKVAGVGLFYKGTKDAPYTGKAIVDELGAEIRTDQFGNLKSFGSSAGANMVDINKHDIIIPADISKVIKQNLLASYGIKGMSNNISIDYEKIGEQFGKHTTSLIKAIRGTKRGDTIIQIKNSLRDRAQFKGKRT